MTSIYGLVLFCGYFALSLTMLAAFVWLYIRVTPYDDTTDIANGNTAAAIALSGAMLGFTFPLIVASYLQTTVFGFLMWGLISCGVQLGLFWSMYRFLPQGIVANNTAGATCYAAAAVCAGLLNAASFIP
jgi:putative membrane protein